MSYFSETPATFREIPVRSELYQRTIDRLVNTPDFAALKIAFASEIATDAQLTPLQKDLRKLTKDVATPETYTVLKSIRELFAEAALTMLFTFTIKDKSVEEGLQIAATNPHSQEALYLEILTKAFETGAITDDVQATMNNRLGVEYQYSRNEISVLLTDLQTIFEDFVHCSKKSYNICIFALNQTPLRLEDTSVSIETLPGSQLNLNQSTITLNAAFVEGFCNIAQLAVQLNTFNPRQLVGTLIHIQNPKQYKSQTVMTDPNYAGITLESPDTPAPFMDTQSWRLSTDFPSTLQPQLQLLVNQAVSTELERYDTTQTKHEFNTRLTIEKQKKLEFLANYLLQSPLNKASFLKTVWSYRLIRQYKNPNNLTFLRLVGIKRSVDRAKYEDQFTKQLGALQLLDSFKDINLSENERRTVLLEMEKTVVCQDKRQGIVVTLEDVLNEMPHFTRDLGWLTDNFSLANHSVLSNDELGEYKDLIQKSLDTIASKYKNFTALYMRYTGKQAPVLQ